ncbi:unnamed protein product, partial [marine sediment metagenome]
NTSNQSFLRQTFVEGRELEQLLRAPHLSIGEMVDKITEERPDRSESQSELGAFSNEPFADFSLREVRDAFTDAITEIKRELGRTYPLFIGGKEITTRTLIDSVNPARPHEV